MNMPREANKSGQAMPQSRPAWASWWATRAGALEAALHLMDMMQQAHECLELKRKECKDLRKKCKSLEQAFDELNATHERLMEAHEKLGKAPSKLEKSHSSLQSKARMKLLYHVT